ncbi:hypothetical protein ACX8Z9_02805 [Arthrobacter halodurans]|uniref:O-antigen ligase n=1 Tax=Arthrobacter halodurans TaxID=516699 RepID=A0ABV4UKY3_9MICC
MTLSDQRNQILALKVPTGTRIYAGLVALLSGVTFTPISALTWGLLLALPVLPRAIRFAYSQYSVYRRALPLTALALATAPLLSMLALQADSGRDFSVTMALAQTAQILSTLALGAAVIWCTKSIRITTFLALWSIGLILAIPLAPGRFEENPWKFGLALPATLIVSLISTKLGSGVFLPAMCLLAVISIRSDYRSWIALLLIITLIYLVVRARLTQSPRRRLRRGSLIAIGSILLATPLFFLSEILASGLFGRGIAERSQTQADLGGNVFIGGRPEWLSALSLFQREPWGHGLGIVPSTTDYQIAVSAIPVADPRLTELTTIAQYFRSGYFEFHSILWGSWSHFGVAGLLIAISLLFACYAALLDASARRIASVPAVIGVSVVVLSMVLDILFSPFSVTKIAVGLACLSLLHKSTTANREKNDPKTTATFQRNNHHEK